MFPEILKRHDKIVFLCLIYTWSRDIYTLQNLANLLDNITMIIIYMWPLGPSSTVTHSSTLNVKSAIIAHNKHLLEQPHFPQQIHMQSGYIFFCLLALTLTTRGSTLIIFHISLFTYLFHFFLAHVY